MSTTTQITYEQFEETIDRGDFEATEDREAESLHATIPEWPGLPAVNHGRVTLVDGPAHPAPAGGPSSSKCRIDVYEHREHDDRNHLPRQRW